MTNIIPIEPDTCLRPSRFLVRVQLEFEHWGCDRSQVLKTEVRRKFSKHPDAHNDNDEKKVFQQSSARSSRQELCRLNRRASTGIYTASIGAFTTQRHRRTAVGLEALLLRSFVGCQETQDSDSVEICGSIAWLSQTYAYFGEDWKNGCGYVSLQCDRAEWPTDCS